MKRLLLLIILFMPCAATAAQSAQELYDKGDYSAAIAEYKNMAAQDKENPYILYNLGNSHFKAGETDKAIINYYRAWQILPRDKDIQANLAFALNSTGQKFIPEGVPRAVFNLYHYFSLRELRGVFWGFAWVFAVLFAFYFLTGKKAFVKKALILNTVLLVLACVWYFSMMPSQALSRAVVVVPRAEVRSGPGDNFPVSLSIPRAHIVTVTDTKGGWAAVEAGRERTSGWVLKTSIEEI